MKFVGPESLHYFEEDKIPTVANQLTPVQLTTWPYSLM